MPTIVNGQRIEHAEIDAEVERLRPHYENYVRENEAGDDAGDDAGDGRLREWAKENLIERVLIQHAAREMDAEVPAEQIDEAYEQIKDRAGDAPAELVKADIELQMRVERLMAENVEAAAGEPEAEELRAYYEEHRDEMVVPEQVRASHIVKHVHAEADKKSAYEAALDLRMRLEEGLTFEELASQDSDCPENAGDLGLFARGQMVQEFEDVVFGLRVGEVSDVFETPFGYHVAKLYEHRAERQVPFEQVRDRIAEEIRSRRRQEAAEAFVDSLREKATIEEEADSEPEAEAEAEPEAAPAAEPAQGD